MTYIGDSSFMYSKLNNKLKLPNSLTSLGWAPFDNIIVNNLELSNKNIYSYKGMYFSHAQINELIIPENVLDVSNSFGNVDFSNTIVKLYGPERTIEGLDLTQFKEVIWNYQGE